VSTLSLVGIDVLGHSQLVGYPLLGDLQPQYPSVALLNWTTGAGNARYWVLFLLLNTLNPGSDQLLPTTVPATNQFCAQVLGESNLTLSCVDAGSTIQSIDFASYGTPSGDTCGSYEIDNSCHAPTSQSAIASACVGQSACAIAINPNTFGGDPCEGVVKRAYVTATCSNGGAGYAPFSSQLYYAQSYTDQNGLNPRLLLISKSLYPITISIAGMTGWTFSYVDLSTGDSSPAELVFTSDVFTLTPFVVGFAAP